MASGFTICKGALPTWHDSYEKGSTDTVDLEEITVTSFSNATGHTTINSYGKARLSNNTSGTILEQTVPTVPNYLYENKERFVFSGCAPNVLSKLMQQKEITDTNAYGFSLHRARGEDKTGVLKKQNYVDDKLTTVAVTVPYLIYFEIIGGGGGGGGGSGGDVTTDKSHQLGGYGGGSGAAFCGILDFTKLNYVDVLLGTGGIGGTGNSKMATGGAGGTGGNSIMTFYSNGKKMLEVTASGGTGGGVSADKGSYGAGGSVTTTYFNGYSSNNTPGVYILGTTSGANGGAPAESGGNRGDHWPYNSTSPLGISFFDTNTFGALIGANSGQNGQGSYAGTGAGGFGAGGWHQKNNVGLAGGVGAGGAGGDVERKTLAKNSVGYNGGAGGTGMLRLYW